MVFIGKFKLSQLFLKRLFKSSHRQVYNITFSDDSGEFTDLFFPSHPLTLNVFFSFFFVKPFFIEKRIVYKKFR